MDDHKNEYPLEDSTLNRVYAATTAFLGEWLILLLTCSIALFFIPLTPTFTLHSTSVSLLNITPLTHNRFTANLTVGFLIQDSNPIATTINYHSFHVSLFHRQQTLSTFSLHDSFQQETTIQANFPNVSLAVDQWGLDHGATQPHGTSCGLAHVDLWFTVNATYTQWPTVRDTLQGRCGEVKFELCSSGVTSFLQSCHVYSGLVHNVRLVLLALLILLLVTAAAVPLIVQKFFCSQS
ncbi:hypothetical protein VNO77_36737 [Canavalia gladiata]|uniref:Late embryogenesis abundant protein LEA-2 subgroup domain-containing protein n=1 Tax=Canavalia gladiata TaxID=3824 RepID=A0AAN9PXY3_CANGL